MYRRFIKRLLDLFFSIIAFPFVIILMIMIMPIIYISDPGPIFYNTKRRGRNGKILECSSFAPCM